MRHGNKVNHLGRKYAHRKALLSNLACSLIEHKRIKTTLAKAKELRKYVEPLLTKAKNNTTHNRRTVFGRLRSKFVITELFDEVALKIANRPGGYTRIVRLGRRAGDAAEICLIELVDYNELLLKDKAGDGSAAKKTRRSKRKNVTAPVAAAATAVAEMVQNKVETVVETVSEVVATVEENITASPDLSMANELMGKKVQYNDLKVVEGIGPAIEGLLHAAGITTWAELAAAPVERIEQILDEAGSRFSTHNPATWSKQAQMAHDGAWAELKAYQDELDGGKEVTE